MRRNYSRNLALKKLDSALSTGWQQGLTLDASKIAAAHRAAR
jgi:hypothetical protein